MVRAASHGAALNDANGRVGGHRGNNGRGGGRGNYGNRGGAQGGRGGHNGRYLPFSYPLAITNHIPPNAVPLPVAYDILILPVGGRLKQFVQNWREISNDPWVINTVSEGLWLDFQSPPIQSFRFPEISMNAEQMALCDSEVEALILKNAIVLSREELGDFISNIFVIPKKLKGFRPVINLKYLNEFLVFHHFKMEGLHMLNSLVNKGDFFVKLDLKDAYFTVAIHRDHTHFLKFQWRGKIYMFTCLPFGLSSAPWAFTKLMRVAMTVLRRQGVKIIIYLDDLLIIGSSADAVIEDLQKVRCLLENLGFILNIEKSDLKPKQVMEFLGLLVDSLRLSLSLPEDKIVSITSACQVLLSKPEVSLREIGSILGSFSWATAALVFGQAHYRALQKQHIIGCGLLPSLNSQVSLSIASRNDLLWWVNNLTTSNGKSWRENDPDVIIYSDASLKGWGGSCNGVTAGGPWTQLSHINDLELSAAFNCLRAFCPYAYDLSILLYLDNKSAVAYINRNGGSRSSSLNTIAMSIIDWCEARRSIIRAVYLPGIDNCIADAVSRRDPNIGDWHLAPYLFRRLFNKWDMSVDLFASSWNAQLPRFVSWEPQPGAWRVDAFSFSWKESTGFAFPPFSLIKDCVAKVKREQADLILITPFWPSQPWFPAILDLVCEPPLVFPLSNDLLSSATGDIHPLVQSGSMLLIAWKLCGQVSVTRAFREKWSNCSWRVHASPRTLLTSQPGTAGVIGILKEVPIPCFLL